MFNRILALLLLIVLAPIFLLIALFIYLEDGSPVIFKQWRVGKDCVHFWIYKFRTMSKDTPNLPTHELQDANRYLLRTGRVLRKLSLDELPNLINIVRGEMAFIGPRPALYNQYDLIELRVHAGVHTLKPGITGWAQVNGRDDLSLEEKVFYETQYMDRRTIGMDLKILALTAFGVVRSKGVRH